MNVCIENSTDDDATVKVSPGGPGQTVKPRSGQTVKKKLEQTMTLPRGKTLEFTVVFGRRKVKSPTLNLKLTRAANNGYEMVTNGKK